MNPLISIIVPVYNVENCICRCVDSILNQSFSDFELLLIDNNSKDGSLAICREYEKKDKRIIVCQQTKKGASATRNMGIEKARGRYILFVDSDDYVKENYLSALVQATDHYPENANIWFGFMTVDDKKEADYKAVKRTGNRELYSVVGRSLYMTLHEKWLTQNLWNKLFVRDIIIKNNIRMDEWMSVGEDIVFILKYLDCAGQEEIVFIDEILYVYIIFRENSLMNSFHDNRVELSRGINENLLFYTEKWNISESERKKVYNAAFYGLENSMRSIAKNKASMSTIKRIKKCNSILRSDDFRLYLKNCNCRIHTLQRLAYKSSFYPFVMLFDSMYDFKRKHIGKKGKNQLR